MIAPWIHEQFEQTAFLALLAPPSLPGHRVLAEQKARIVDVAGASSAEVDSIREESRRVFEVIRFDQDSVTVVARLRSILGASNARDDRLQLMVKANATRWFRVFCSLRPARPELRQVEVPILALFGGRDLIAPPQQNAAPMRKALAESPPGDTEVHVIRKVNHWMQPAAHRGRRD